jgi:hypothetical protein
MAPLGLLALSSVLCLVERFPKTRRIPYILIHLSIIVVALGATMRTYAKKEGMLHLVIGQASNKLLVMEDGTGTNRVEILPFSVRLDKFDVEFYESTPMVYAFLAGSERPVAALDLSKGEEATVAGMLIRTKGLRTVKIAPAAGHDPVDVEVAVVEFNGQEGVLVEGDPVGNDRLALVYQNQDGEVKLYQSRLTILDEAGNEVVTKDVLVNHPLLQAGWWLYQSNWNPRDLRYSGIHAVYDPGLPVAVIGLVMLVLGTLLIVRIKRRKKEVAS